MIISTIVVVVLFALNKFSITQKATITGTVRLESVNEDVNELKSQLSKGFESQTEQIDRFRDEMRSEFRNSYTRIEALEREGYNLRWRLEQIEKRQRNGGERSAI